MGLSRGNSFHMGSKLSVNQLHPSQFISSVLVSLSRLVSVSNFMRKSSTSFHRKTNSMASTRAVTPLVALFESEEPSGVVFISLPRVGYCLPSSEATTRQRQSETTETSIVGVVTGETAKYFLVKRSSTYVPVSKSQFFTSHGDPLPNLQLQDVKKHKVRVEAWATPQPRAYLLSPSEDLPDPPTDRILQDFETDAGFSEEEHSKALETQVALNTELLTDVVALASMAPENKRCQMYLRHRSSKLRKSVDLAVETLRGVRSDLYNTAKPECKQLLGNMELLTSDTVKVCSQCRTAEARLTLSCQHLLCSQCAARLTAQAGKKEGSGRCPMCQRPLTVTDSRLALLERYEVLKKSAKYSS